MIKNVQFFFLKLIINRTKHTDVFIHEKVFRLKTV